jgi:hypothetical protein
MRRMNLILFVIVVVIILFSVVRALFEASPEQRQHEPKHTPAASAQTTLKHG